MPLAVDQEDGVYLMGESKHYMIFIFAHKMTIIHCEDGCLYTYGAAWSELVFCNSFNVSAIKSTSMSDKLS